MFRKLLIYLTSVLALLVPITQAADKDCSQKEVQQRVFKERVDTTTHWTPEKLRKLIDSGETIYIHWRWEGRGNNKGGDGFLCDLTQDFREIDKFVMIELSGYSTIQWQALVSIPQEYSKQSGSIRTTPTGTLYGTQELLFRINGAAPSKKFSYEKIKTTMKEALSKKKMD